MEILVPFIKNTRTYIQTPITEFVLHYHSITVFPWILPALKLFPNWSFGSSWTKYIFPLNSPRTMRMCNYLGGHGSTFNCLITRVAPECGAKIVEIIVYVRSALQYNWIRSIYNNQAQISCSFGLNLLGCIRARKYSDINCTCPCIVPTLELYPHVSTLNLILIIPAGRIQGNTVYLILHAWKLTIKGEKTFMNR